jgi:NTP pyrophosphatase (non-canonical NTP hydrolase)
MKNVQKMVEEFAKERGWEKQLPDHIAKSISIEAAELLEHFQWVTPTAKEIMANPEKLAEVRAELADVLIYSLQMANLLGVNVNDIVEEKLKFAAKKYPAHIVNEHFEDKSVSYKKYLEIKKSYRQRK